MISLLHKVFGELKKKLLLTLWQFWDFELDFFQEVSEFTAFKTAYTQKSLAKLQEKWLSKKVF